MAKEIKFMKVALGRDKEVRKAEEELAALLSAGWRIVSSGGGTGKAIGRLRFQGVCT